MRAVASIAVVALVILLTCGMLLPRIMRGRQDAARVYCLDNLRTLGIALIEYHKRHDALPPAVAAAPGLAPEERVSWQAAVLPHLKEEALSKEVDSRAGWDAPANRTTLQTGVAKLRCPAVVIERGAAENNVTHYPGVAGLGPDAARLPLDDPRAGCFGYRREATLDYIREWDGTSATILVLETARDNGPWLAGGPPTTRGLDPARPPYLGAGGQFGGTHAAGAHALYADGSARLHTPDITPRILEALVTLGGSATPP